MKSILILFAHPALQKSRINAQLTKGIVDIDKVTIHDLYEAYPEFNIDIPHEQALVEQHDIIVFHHPLFWYSTPAILKEWQDLVLQHGWAFGSEGNALKGKLFFNIITTGGGENAFTSEGYQQHSLREFLVPIEQTSNLCKMIFLPPFVVHGTHSMKLDGVHDHRENLLQILVDLSEDRIDIDAARRLKKLNDYFETVN